MNFNYSCVGRESILFDECVLVLVFIYQGRQAMGDVQGSTSVGAGMDAGSDLVGVG